MKIEDWGVVGCSQCLLTDLQDPTDGALLEQPHALAEGGVLVLERGGGAAEVAGARVHADVALVPGEGPEHEALLHGLGDAREPLLDPLEGDGPGHQLGGDVEQRAGAVPPAHQLYVGGLCCHDGASPSRCFATE